MTAPNRSAKRRNPTLTQAQRRERGNRVMLSVTVLPSTVELLDEIKGARSRGAVIDELAAAAAKKARK